MRWLALKSGFFRCVGVVLAALAGVATLAHAGTARAEQRIALVIGNAAYEINPALDNPAHDARLMAETLGSLGFEVIQLIDADQATMKDAIANFGRSLRAGGPDTVGLFYYAGHAVQAKGNNYLIPIRSTIRDEADLDLVGVEGRWVLRQMESARNITNIVILDACRDNPFAEVGAVEQGLARMDAPTGTFITYATAPGRVAYDGTGMNSPFTAALAQAMTQPGVPIEQMFKDVRVAVLEATNGAQTPWDSSSLVRDFTFRPAEMPTAQEQAERRLWEAVSATRDPVQLVLFLRNYPDSPYADEARSLVNEALLGVSAEPVPAPGETGSGAAEVEVELAAVPGALGFSLPLVSDDPSISGRSIEQIIKGSPKFTPVEGLDDAAWKGQTCSTCHQWTKEALCDQGKFYVKEGEARTQSKLHPLGGAFKLALFEWAGADCP
ncbi:MAG: caspase family protein [Geminicoccaceae bacterium]|nr:caspase family protein [Geminicoccaceae bacterium]HRY22974.1 caspase domain-containing protein [Geminicoccaceae bacterium]